MRCGIEPDRHAFGYRVYSGNKVTISGLHTNVGHYFTADAVYDSGVTKGTEVQPASGRK